MKKTIIFVLVLLGFFTAPALADNEDSSNCTEVIPQSQMVMLSDRKLSSLYEIAENCQVINSLAYKSNRYHSLTSILKFPQSHRQELPYVVVAMPQGTNALWQLDMATGVLKVVPILPVAKKKLFLYSSTISGI